MVEMRIVRNVLARRSLELSSSSSSLFCFVVSSVMFLLLLLFVRKTCYVGLPTTCILCLPHAKSNVRSIPCVQLRLVHMTREFVAAMFVV